MKGLDLSIRILIPTVLVIFVVAGILDVADSLSGLHKTSYDVLLYACLLFIFKTLFDTAQVAQERDKVLTKVFGIEYRLKHALKLSGWFFGGVIIFGVNSEVLIFGISVYALHLIFTALSIITGYSIILFNAKTKRQRIFSYIKTGFGVITFALGFFFNVYSVTWAEFLVAIPIVIETYSLIKIKKS